MEERTYVYMSGDDLTVYENYEAFKEKLIRACLEGQHYIPAITNRLGRDVDAFINVHRIDYIERG